jgi:hypothetical protein
MDIPIRINRFLRPDDAYAINGEIVCGSEAARDRLLTSPTEDDLWLLAALERKRDDIFSAFRVPAPLLEPQNDSVFATRTAYSMLKPSIYFGINWDVEPPSAPNCRCVLSYDTRTRAMRGNERRRQLLMQIREKTKKSSNNASRITFSILIRLWTVGRCS